MFDVGKSYVTYTNSEDSFFQRSPSGISYRIPKKWISLFNQHIKRIAEEAVQVAKSFTPFKFIRGDWAKTITYGSKLGIADSITIFNKKSDADMPYESKYTDGGHPYYFPVFSSNKPNILRMLEKGRRTGYTIVPKKAKALIFPNTKIRGKGNRREKPLLFAKKVTINNPYPHVTKPITRTMKFMKDALNKLLSNFNRSGIENTVLTKAKESQLGEYTRVARTATRNTRGKR